ncbi:hypothetical protein [Bradyrhizobium sp. Tv2a-2]|uniref:hypothetical protein n=1 Tax=Bradyrhizobium sp. Tv2a-2 TaxID=113395 RepID=UPI00041E1BD0|nr:hypothetical protein [Bradyrhizobium sp. Tv2a-2]
MAWAADLAKGRPSRTEAAAGRGQIRSGRSRISGHCIYLGYGAQNSLQLAKTPPDVIFSTVFGNGTTTI